MVMFQDLETPDHRKKVRGRDEVGFEWVESPPLPSESSLFLQVPAGGPALGIICAGHMFTLGT